MLPAEIAGVLNVPLSGAGEPAMPLLNFLKNKQMLLVLDNFEHVLDGAELLGRILAEAPRIKMLVTSREALNLVQEWRLELTGLPLPELSGENVSANSAVQLFVERAGRVRSDFSPQGNEACIADICRLVAGMPLAIELAASWIRAMSCNDIAQEIESDLGTLEANLRDVPGRHRSIRAVLEQSWSQLGEREKRSCSAMALFSGGFTLPAARAVAQATPAVLTALVDKSLLRRDRVGRYQMHDLVKQYAAEKLASDQEWQQLVQERHSAYYSHLAYEHRRSWTGHDQLQAVELFKHESYNLLQAWAWNLNNAEFQRLDQMVFSLCEFLFWQGRLGEGVRHCRELEDWLSGPESELLVAPEQVALARAKALLWESIFITQSLNNPLARQRIEAAQTLLDTVEPKQADGRFIQAHVWLQHGRTSLSLGDVTGAEHSLRQSRATFLDLNEAWGAAASWYWLGLLATARGADDVSRDAFSQSLALFEEVGDRRNIASAKDALAISLRNLEQFGGVISLHQEAIAAAEALNDPLRIGWMSHNCTWSLNMIGDYAAGAVTGQQCIAVAEDVGNSYILAAGQGCTAACLLHLGEFEQAWKLAEAAYSQELKGAFWQPFVPQTYGQAALALERFELAQQLIGESVEILMKSRPSRAAGPLASLVLAAVSLGKVEEAKQHLARCLSLAIESGMESQLQRSLFAAAIFSANGGDQASAAGLLALAYTGRHFADSQWYAEIAGRFIDLERIAAARETTSVESQPLEPDLPLRAAVTTLQTLQ
jgi:predicted ATPase